jgi:predicted Rossmann fold nucleotide-binding protein DprA/Smf involved in DNA uptake
MSSFLRSLQSGKPGTENIKPVTENIKPVDCIYCDGCKKYMKEGNFLVYAVAKNISELLQQVKNDKTDTEKVNECLGFCEICAQNSKDPKEIEKAKQTTREMTDKNKINKEKLKLNRKILLNKK